MKRLCVLRALICTAGLCGLLTGCAAQPVQTPLAQLPPLTPSYRPSFSGSLMPAPSAQWISQKYTDLPIPKDFRFLPDDSFVFIQGSQRRADLNYEGTLPPRDLIQFYQEAMPTHGWQFRRMAGVRMKTLTYVKGNELVDIIIESHAPHHEIGDAHEDEHQQQLMTHLHIQLGQL